MPLTFEKSRHGDYWIVRDGFKTGIINLRLDGLFYFRSDGNDKYSLDDLKEIIEYMRQLGAVARGCPIFFKNIGNYCYEVSWDNDIEPTDYPYNIGIIEKMQYYQSFYVTVAIDELETIVNFLYNMECYLKTDWKRVGF